ncbi:hypothetical protein IAU59_003236 [Kwoniella sp. CBS 9459]
MPKRARSPSPSPRNSRNRGITSSDSILPDTGARHHASAPNQPLQEEHERSLNGDRKKLAPGRKKGVSDLFPFQEIFLRILSFLTPSELAQAQRVSQYWARMSVDPQLWKRLYLSRYPHPHHSRLLYSNSSTDQNGAWATPSSSSSSLTPRTPRSLRPIARLPSRAFPPPSPKRSPSIGDGVLTPTPDRTALRPRADMGAYAGLGRATPLQSRDVSNGTDGSGSALAGIAEAGASAEAQEEVGRGVRNDGVDWKLMLRLGTNWSNGNALSQSTITLPPSPSPSLSCSSTAIPPLSLSPSVTPAHHHSRFRDQGQGQGQTEQFIALSPSFIFISSPLSPLVQVHAASSHSSTSNSSASSTPLGIIPPPPGWSNPHRPDNVTAIVADQSVVTPDETDFGQPEGALPARIVVFYQSGGFVLLHISTQSGASSSGIKWKRDSIHPPHTRPHSIKRRATAHQPLEGDPVVLAALHYPILISCTRDFHLSVYTFPTVSPNPGTASANPAPRHLKTLHSEVSFHPAALSLFPAPTVNGIVGGDLSTRSILKERDESDRFRAALTYCTPLYPSSWTVAVQELSISQHLGEVRRGDSYHVGRSAGNDYGEEDDDDTIVWPRKIRPIVGVKGKATGVGSDGRWCVLSGEGSQIQVYSLPHHPRVNHYHPLDDDTTHIENNLHAATYRNRRYLGDDEYTTQPIVHSQTLLAHSTEITSLALSAGRCVSGGRDGRVLVWELDEDVDDEADGSSIDWKSTDVGEGRMGRTVGYVEVKPGGRRSTWRGAAGPLPSADGASDNSDLESESDDDQIALVPRIPRSVPRDKSALPHPQSISSAARSLFLPRPPTDYVNSSSGAGYGDALGLEDETPAIRHLVFDEEKIVGLVRTGEDVMKVWNFSA